MESSGSYHRLGVPQRRASGRGGRAGKGYDEVKWILAVRARLALPEGSSSLPMPQPVLC